MLSRGAVVTVLALASALVLGAVVGVLPQLDAASRSDPRPSVPLPTMAPQRGATSSPTPSLEPSTSPSPSATPSPSPESLVWRYTIEPGDSLSGIAIRFGTTTEEILTLNPEYTQNQELVEPGAQVILPCTPIAVAEQRC